MEDNKELVTEVTENAEETPAEEIVDFVEGEETETEEPVIESEETAPVESEEDKINRLASERVDEILPKKIARREAKIRRDYEKKYKKLERIVNAGLGTESIDDATAKLEEFYASKGIQIPQEPQYSNEELEVLAKSDADKIIELGYDEIREETDRLANDGNLSERERKELNILVQERSRIEQQRELEAIGVKPEELDNPEFKLYASKLNPNLTLKEKYEMYLDKQPKKEIKQIGSMKGVEGKKVKDYYTPEEISKLTDEELDDPQIWAAVRKSMTHQS